MKQEDLAKKLNEKESVIHNIEAERLEPNITLARKLERFLKVKLVDEGQVESSVASGRDASPVTIGDVIKIRKK